MAFIPMLSCPGHCTEYSHKRWWRSGVASVVAIPIALAMGEPAQTARLRDQHRPEASDFGAGFDANGQRDATANDYQFRVRGLPGGVGRVFVASAVPVDLYRLFCPADGRTA